MRYASGENYTIELEAGVAIVRVFRRADLDGPSLTTLASEVADKATVLATEDSASGIVVDLRRVSGAVSPTVEASYARLAQRWEATAQHIAFLVGDPVQRMQLSRVQSQSAPRFGAVFSNREEARRFVGAGMSPETGIHELRQILADRPSKNK